MIFKENENILKDLLNSSEVITKIRENYLKEFNSYLEITKSTGYCGEYQITMNRDYIDENIKTKLSRIFSFIKPSIYRRYVNMAIIGLSELFKELTVHNNELEEHREEIVLNLGFLLILEAEYNRFSSLRDKVIDNYYNEIAEFKLNCLLYCLSSKKEIVQDEHSGDYFIRDLFGFGYFDTEKFKGCYELNFHVDSIENNKVKGKFTLSTYPLLDKSKPFEIELNPNSNKEAIFLSQLKTKVNNKDKLNPNIDIINDSYNIEYTDIRNIRKCYNPDPYIEFINKVDDWFIKVNEPTGPKIYCVFPINIEVTEVKENGIIYTIIKNFTYNQEIKLMCRITDIPFLNIK